MKYFLLVILFLSYGVSSYSEESSSEATEEVSTEKATESAAESKEENTTNSSAQAESNDVMADCDNSYTEYVKSLPKNKQQAEFENWWEYNDSQLKYYKTDEFKLKEERPKWQKIFNDKLAKSDDIYTIVPKVKIGQYDFKKKGFPVDIKTGGKEKHIESHISDSFSMGGLGSRTTDKVYCPGQHDLKKDNPSEVLFVLQNLSQLKFISVPEEKAKLLTASLGSGRLTEMNMKIKPIKTIKVTRKLGAMKFTHLQVEAKIQEASVKVEDETLKFSF